MSKLEKAIEKTVERIVLGMVWECFDMIENIEA